MLMSFTDWYSQVGKRGQLVQFWFSDPRIWFSDPEHPVIDVGIVRNAVWSKCKDDTAL